MASMSFVSGFDALDDADEGVGNSSGMMYVLEEGEMLD